MPTVAEFLKFCEEHANAELRTTKALLSGPKGRVKINYLFRRTGKKIWHTEPLPTDHNERMTPDTLRRLCKQIGISEKEFGLNLG